MNGLIGNNTEVKLIFLSCADEEDLPTKKDIKEYYPLSEVNIYKSHGHFSESFCAIEALMSITLCGVESHSSLWNNKTHCITHAIRLNADCDRNSFFDLKYSEISIAYLKLNHAELSKLEGFIHGVGLVNSLIKSITGTTDTFESVKHELNKMSLNDPKVDNPCAQSMAILFDGYGDKAREKMKSCLDSWHKKNVWV